MGVCLVVGGVGGGGGRIVCVCVCMYVCVVYIPSCVTSPDELTLSLP